MSTEELEKRLKSEKSNFDKQIKDEKAKFAEEMKQLKERLERELADQTSAANLQLQVISTRHVGIKHSIYTKYCSTCSILPDPKAGKRSA